VTVPEMLGLGVVVGIGIVVFTVLWAVSRMWRR